VYDFNNNNNNNEVYNEGAVHCMHSHD